MKRSLLLILCAASLTAQAPVPLLKAGSPVDWWFVFKFNSETAPMCADNATRACPYGGVVATNYKSFSLQYAFASSDNQTLQAGGGCLSDTTADPVGATYAQIYNGKFFYVVWNDQFYGHPLGSETAPAGHSKGMLAWDADGNGVVLQVSTPDWPGAGSKLHPRQGEGNTLGCVKGDNDIMVSQHFFALKLTPADVLAVVQSLANASVVTDVTDSQIVNNGGPADIQAAVKLLGPTSPSTTPMKTTLSTGVTLISKPSDLQVPPWQFVSAELASEPLRVATWWATPQIPSAKSMTPKCWSKSLAKPGSVAVATSGTWNGKSIGFIGMADPEGNHAKIGVSTGKHTYSIFGDMNQDGSLNGPNCKSAQNGRGGLFFVVNDPALFKSVSGLLKGTTAPSK